ncbi:hypothetical protein GQ44DRAFT_773059 [Phaeosphaeriaceae sp. PMI808]|nr:hypothetical protein GQ44DRAFT_773059 [Phaeosphaeriaceae sp. PMI808]
MLRIAAFPGFIYDSLNEGVINGYKFYSYSIPSTFNAIINILDWFESWFDASQEWWENFLEELHGFIGNPINDLEHHHILQILRDILCVYIIIVIFRYLSAQGSNVLSSPTTAAEEMQAVQEIDLRGNDKNPSPPQNLIIITPVRYQGEKRYRSLSEFAPNFAPTGYFNRHHRQQTSVILAPTQHLERNDTTSPILDILSPPRSTTPPTPLPTSHIPGPSIPTLPVASVAAKAIEPTPYNLFATLNFPPENNNPVAIQNIPSTPQPLIGSVNATPQLYTFVQLSAELITKSEALRSSMVRFLNKMEILSDLAEEMMQLIHLIDMANDKLKVLHGQLAQDEVASLPWARDIQIFWSAVQPHGHTLVAHYGPGMEDFLRGVLTFGWYINLPLLVLNMNPPPPPAPPLPLSLPQSPSPQATNTLQAHPQPAPTEPEPAAKCNRPGFEFSAGEEAGAASAHSKPRSRSSKPTSNDARRKAAVRCKGLALVDEDRLAEEMERQLAK